MDGSRVSNVFTHVCLSVCDSACLFVCQHDNSKRMNFKLAVGNDLGIAYRWHDFWVKRLWLGLQKHIEGDRVAGVSYALYRASSL